jgi:hypothetical protein
VRQNGQRIAGADCAHLRSRQRPLPPVDIPDGDEDQRIVMAFVQLRLAPKALIGRPIESKLTEIF